MQLRRLKLSKATERKELKGEIWRHSGPLHHLSRSTLVQHCACVKLPSAALNTQTVHVLCENIDLHTSALVFSNFVVTSILFRLAFLSHRVMPTCDSYVITV